MTKTSASKSVEADSIDSTTTSPKSSSPRSAGAKATGTRRKKVPARLPKNVAAAIGAALEKKALDVVLLDLRKADGFTDFFLICTGGNARQIGAIADAVEETLRTEFAERPHLREGVEKSQWLLVDYFNFVVHIFTSECRAFYDLERLWGNAERYELSDPE